jgi:hypothetical protein
MAEPDSIRVPVFEGLKGPIRIDERPYEEVLGEFTSSADQLPQLVKALKEADDEGWGRLFNDVAAHIEKSPELQSVVRIRERDGEQSLSIGEPNWTFVAIVLSFAAGYAVGTACYKAGPCKFV